MAKIVFNETKPERMVREELTRRGIIFIQEKALRLGFVADFFIPDKNLLIEVDGEHWHIKGNKRDGFRDYMIRRGGYKIIRIREKDIYANVLKCIEEIVKKANQR